MAVAVHRIEDDDTAFEIAFEIRAKVFEEEFGVEEEMEHDDVAHHYLAFVDEVPAGSARWRISLGGKVKLERFAVLKEYRGHGVGKALLETILTHLPKGREVYLEALGDVTGFYARCGFVAEGEPYVEAGLVHQRMVLV